MPKNILTSAVAILAVAGAASSANAALVISSVPTSNVTCTAGTCTATAPDEVLNSKDSVRSSYSIGLISGEGAFSYGGFYGIDDASNAADYWDLDTSGISNPSMGAGNIANDPGVTGLSDIALKASLPDGFNSKTWGQSASINSGYPYLLVNPTPQ